MRLLSYTVNNDTLVWTANFEVDKAEVEAVIRRFGIVSVLGDVERPPIDP